MLSKSRVKFIMTTLMILLFDMDDFKIRMCACSTFEHRMHVVARTVPASSCQQTTK